MWLTLYRRPQSELEDHNHGSLLCFQLSLFSTWLESEGGEKHYMGKNYYKISTNGYLYHKNLHVVVMLLHDFGAMGPKET